MLLLCLPWKNPFLSVITKQIFITSRLQLNRNTVARRDDVAQLSPAGVVTYAEAPRLRSALFDLMGERGLSAVVVHLGELAYMDTTGVAVLIEALREARRRGRLLLLCEPNDSVRAIFKLAGFEDVLEHCCAAPSEVANRLANEVGS